MTGARACGFAQVSTTVFSRAPCRLHAEWLGAASKNVSIASDVQHICHELSSYCVVPLLACVHA